MKTLNWMRKPSNAFLIWSGMTLGILFRIRQYVFDRSLWLDESMLSLNVIRRSPAELMKPLDYFQGAPIGFLWLQKFSVLLLGSSELALRLVPILAGVGSVFLFAMVARRFLTLDMAPIAVAMFAFCTPLIYYSSEAKQYSSDVAVILILYLAVNPLLAPESELRPMRLVLISLVGAAAVWFSHPAAFVLVPAALGAFWTSDRGRDRSRLSKISFPIAAWAASFLVVYLLSVRTLTHNRPLLEYWNGAFAPFPFSSVGNALWYLNSFFDLFSNPAGLTFAGIAAIAAILGAVEFFEVHFEKFLLLVGPAGLALLASGLHRYPFQGRLLLFVVPSAILLITAGLGRIKQSTHYAVPLLSSLFVGLLFLHPIMQASRDFAKPHGVEELRPVLQYVEKHRSAGDVLYCYHGAEHQLEYYNLRGVIGPMKTTVGVAAEKNWYEYRADLDKLRGPNRVWVVFSHVHRNAGADEELLLLDYLDGIGRRLDSSHAVGASAYLYDLSGQNGRPLASAHLQQNSFTSVRLSLRSDVSLKGGPRDAHCLDSDPKPLADPSRPSEILLWPAATFRRLETRYS